jgi:hypothetical protein
MNITTRIAAVTLVAAVLPLAGGTAAQAGDDGRVIREGSCSGSADWKIKAKPDDGKIEVEAEIDSNRNGQVWRWRLKHNGNLRARGTATTHAPSGSFEVTRRTNDAAGTDSFKFRAVHKRTGQVCVARVRL